MTSALQALIVELDGPVATVKLNRPGKDTTEACKAYVEKRAPVFHGR